MGELVLYCNPISSASQRVEITLALKGLKFTRESVDLTVEAGAEFLAINAQGMVPTMMDGQRIFSQSCSIIEYLDDVYPEPRLLPVDDRDRARVRALAAIIVSDIHPINSLRVTGLLRDRFGADDAAILDWQRHWMTQGLAAIERMVAGHPSTSTFCQGDSLSMADICLTPQVHLAQQADVDLSGFPETQRIYEECMWLDEFRKALPEN